jgi:hypothetical protein
VFRFLTEIWSQKLGFVNGEMIDFCELTCALTEESSLL